MTPDAMALARRRLQLGITNIGFWVVAASGGLFFLCRARQNAINLSDGALVFAAAVAAQAVLDFLGGRLLMPELRPTMRAYLRSWSRGVLAHSLVLASVGDASTIGVRKVESGSERLRASAPSTASRPATITIHADGRKRAMRQPSIEGDAARSSGRYRSADCLAAMLNLRY